jgi:hypothetical protein
MKRTVLTLLLALSPLALFAAEVSTDLNATPAQLTSRYGKPVKVETGYYGPGTSYSYHPSHNLYVYATTNPYGTKVEDVIYVQASGAFSKAQKSHLLQLNSDPHIAYWGDSGASDGFGEWDGTEEVKRLGKERNLIVKSDLNWSRWGIIAKVTDNGGYQVRTKKQFYLEQKFIR